MGNDYFEQHQCTDFCDDRKEIVARDKREKRIYKIINKTSKKFCLVRVDGCLIIEGKKCDYLIVNCTDQSAIFIELKGSHLPEAAEQIDASLTQLQKHLPEFTIYARIVTSKMTAPDLNSSQITKLRKKLKK